MKEAQNAIDMLKQEQQNKDTEVAHINADAILCTLLEELGYAEVVAEYHKVSKHYT